jgi:hypothetical protein
MDALGVLEVDIHNDDSNTPNTSVGYNKNGEEAEDRQKL